MLWFQLILCYIIRCKKKKTIHRQNKLVETDKKMSPIKKKINSRFIPIKIEMDARQMLFAFHCLINSIDSDGIYVIRANKSNWIFAMDTLRWNVQELVLFLCILRSKIQRKKKSILTNWLVFNWCLLIWDVD